MSWSKVTDGGNISLVTLFAVQNILCCIAVHVYRAIANVH